MTRPKKPLKLSEMTPGAVADCFAQLAEKHRKTTQGGKPFYSCRFRDARRVVSVVVWADSGFFEDCQHWQVGQFFKLRATYGEHERYGPQLDVEQVRPVGDRDREDGFTELDFVDRSRRDPDEMLAELRALVAKEIADRPLVSLVQKLLAEYEAELKRVPGSSRYFYPFAGGWLEHTLAVTRNCAWLADRYAQQFPDLTPPLNRDLVVAGAVLHDVGRAKEFDVPVFGQPSRPGVRGELFGHVVLAYDMIRSAAADVPDLNPELLDLLLHVVLAHLKTPEWGSPRLPCIPEVLILHHADDLDAKMEMYYRCLTRDTSDGPFTDRDPVLNRPLLKRRGV
ncbi:MAG TPA: HD domain-containing protein [Gemmata sp.]|jgi:3'-5' exoribonuclease|nr:HD domain-containing protein [Gemmata sp.]